MKNKAVVLCTLYTFTCHCTVELKVKSWLLGKGWWGGLQLGD